MQVLLHCDNHIESGHLMAEHLQTVVTAALGRFGDRIKRVEAHLSEVEGRSRHSDESLHCTLEARLADMEAVVVSEHGASAHQAIEGGVRKLKRAVGVAIGKRDPRRQLAMREAVQRRTEPVTPGEAATEPGAPSEPVVARATFPPSMP